MLGVRFLTVQIGARTILSDMTMSFPKGRLSVIIGPNGAGKSTLLRVLSGEMRPSQGRVRFGGMDLHSIDAHALASRRAVMPQATQLAFPFRVEEVVALGASVPAFASRTQDASVREAMAIADVAHLAGRDYMRLSGGERQRVHFARALCQLLAAKAAPETTVLLLDEPTSSLDLPHQMHLMERASVEAGRGRTVVAVLHDLNLAATWADQIVALAGGTLAAVGRPADVLTSKCLSEVYRYPISVSELEGSAGTPAILPQKMRLGEKRDMSASNDNSGLYPFEG